MHWNAPRTLTCVFWEYIPMPRDGGVYEGARGAVIHKNRKIDGHF